MASHRALCRRVSTSPELQIMRGTLTEDFLLVAGKVHGLDASALLCEGRRHGLLHRQHTGPSGIGRGDEGPLGNALGADLPQ